MVKLVFLLASLAVIAAITVSASKDHCAKLYAACDNGLDCCDSHLGRVECSRTARGSYCFLDQPHPTLRPSIPPTVQTRAPITRPTPKSETQTTPKIETQSTQTTETQDTQTTSPTTTETKPRPFCRGDRCLTDADCCPRNPECRFRLFRGRICVG